MFIGTIAAIGNGVSQPISFIIFGELIDSFIDKESGEPFIDLDKEMAKFALFYVYVAAGTLVCGYIQNTLWLLSSIRQTFLIRTKTFRSIMRQDIGYFDTADSGELSTRLVE